MSLAGQAVNLFKVFRTDNSTSGLSGVRGETRHLFRGMICYYGLHYVAFFLNRTDGSWLMFDDHVVRPLGRWEEVKERCLQGKWQPVMVFYECNQGEARPASHPGGRRAALSIDHHDQRRERQCSAVRPSLTMSSSRPVLTPGHALPHL